MIVYWLSFIDSFITPACICHIKHRCFGLLICPGREVPDREMHLLDVVSKRWKGKKGQGRAGLGRGGEISNTGALVC